MKSNKIICYPKVSRYEFGNYGIGGPGLGNMLFPWSRACVFARDNHGILLSPAWAQIKPARLLRGDMDRRNYSGYFKHNNEYWSGLKKIMAIFTTRIIDESQRHKAVLQNSVIVKFEGMATLFEEIKSESAFIRQELLNITREEHKNALCEDFSRTLCVHIRLGDFQAPTPQALSNGQTNTRIPLSWYIKCVEKIRAQYPMPLKVCVFSDGSNEELGEMLSMKDTYRADYGSAVADLLALSCGKILVASGSTFSMWASYLGRMDVIWYKGQLKQKLYHDGEALEVEWDGEDNSLDNMFKNRH
ncbi:alpha-1,2-fucosyltransferase [Pectobacteriaceae bacterium CE70]|nr:alpha-1,2-fucosyltransferase [Pectobacteriaceae bacterium C52]WJV65700.1 alpha-1,2-fucosyltransferase [Pectobacteriaceae bacterium CE70]WJY09719.1 alpha-1,2-fucosyltransferase [Pectobacteriaceae bacterium C80]